MGNILKSPLNMAHSLPVLSPKPGLHLHNPIRTQSVHLLLWHSHSIPWAMTLKLEMAYLGPPPHTFTSKASLPAIHISPAPLAADSLIPALPALLLPVQQPWTGTLGIFSLSHPPPTSLPQLLSTIPHKVWALLGCRRGRGILLSSWWFTI